MKRCFVMQPFDGDTFDKRYEDVFKPAIIDAGIDCYRVDQDPSVSIPIDDIESGIRNSEICFAELTTDNPNVWFELGFAIAVQKEVVLVCSEDRESKFPFDVQHRNIIQYKTDAPQDFEELRGKITKRILELSIKNLTAETVRLG
jgi:nucleoside 2-deoxyribosyltransferase